VVERRPAIGPSLLSADFSRLAAQIETVEQAGADYFHLDIMDGHFVPPLTFGPKIAKAARKLSRLPLDVHLMVKCPLDPAEGFAKAGADWICFHLETEEEPQKTIAEIRRLGVKVGMSIKPLTPVACVTPHLHLLDYLLIMSVEPGWSGQQFMPMAVDKLREARELASRNGLDVLLQVDGGIDESTAPLAVDAGAALLVAGSSIFGAPDPAKALQQIRDAL
jgi:ribulose-phosphate 3-epimerase